MAFQRRHLGHTDGEVSQCLWCADAVDDEEHVWWERGAFVDVRGEGLERATRAEWPKLTARHGLMVWPMYLEHWKATSDEALVAWIGHLKVRAPFLGQRVFCTDGAGRDPGDARYRRVALAVVEAL